MRFLLATIVLISLFGSLRAQKTPFEINFIEGEYEGAQNIYGELDSATFKLELSRIRNNLFSKGHLLANVDTLNFAETMSATVFIGPKYYWYSLGIQHVPEEYLSKAGYRLKDFINRETNPRQFERLVNRLLRQATSAGYPFASFQLSEIELQNNSLKAILAYTPGPQIRYDSLTIVPTNLVREKFMEAHLNVKRGELFSYDEVSVLENSIQQLPFVRLKEPVELQFANNLCNISFGLEKRKANRFDAIIGFLPNQGTDNGLRITGYADLHLENLFHSGKSLTFQWQQFQALSQTLLLNYNHPNLLRSPIGLDFEANLIRQDTTFLSTNLEFDIFYARNKLELAFLTNIISSRQLSNPVDTTSLPSIADYNMNLFGVNFKFNNVDFRPNPRSAFSLEAGIKFGNKRINKNPNLPEAIYSNLKVNSGQLQINLDSEVNYGFEKLFAFNANLQTGAIWNNDRLFVNDLLRLGGVNSLRGFNELELFISAYALLRLEWRLLMSEASRIFLFYDQAFTVNSIIKSTDTPLGFGAGINLRTGGGDLQLIYALGVSQEQSLSLDQSKIHLGYVATF